ncbi:hypothetical protein OTJ99_001165 [Caldicellulosiruptor naganoensis]|uniref:Uncharacterized protein n=1 Tax=Caldicellulosiruptor naganoensis TaxID=29324 RepID=A0ABY7BIC4_9FIRM|nr:hypothetical protein OTJ99_001165 [Caldicellulosiruptor naganoensis]
MIITVFIRTLILYVLVVLVMRLMGKRQMGELQPFELVITIMISELAAVPMQNTGVPLSKWNYSNSDTTVLTNLDHL